MRLGRNELALVTAVASFLEYKYRFLSKYDLFQEYPKTIKLLNLIGLGFRAMFRLGIGGAEKEVVVEDLHRGYYLLRVGGKTYRVTITATAT